MSEPLKLTWTVHLARKQRGRGAVTACLVVLAACAGWLYAGPLAAVVVTIALMLSLSEFFFPVRYEIDESAATARCMGRTKRVERAQVTNCYVDSDGVKLSTCGGNRRLEPFRGLYLRFDGNSEQVTRFLEDSWERTCRR